MKHVMTTGLRSPRLNSARRWRRFKLQGTENLGIFAKGISQPVVSVEASDPTGTEICEFHGTRVIGCVPDGTGVALVKSPGGDLGTLLIVLATGTVNNY
jgi:hypothetical protein